MNVLFLLNDFPAISETFIRNQMASLSAKGIGVFVIAKRLISEDDIALKGYEQFDFNATTALALSPRNKWIRIIKALPILGKAIFIKSYRPCIKATQSRKYGQRLRSLSELFVVHYLIQHKIDIIHAHYGSNGNKAVFYKKLLPELKVFTTFHGYDILEGLYNGYDYTPTFTQGDAVFSISPYNKDALRTMGAPASKIIDLPNGVDTQFFKPDLKKRANKHTRVLIVGRLSKEKGIDMALRALSHIKKQSTHTIIYSIIGTGPEEATLKQLSKTLELEACIHFKGAQNSMDVCKAMQQSDFLLLPSRTEAFPTVILESLSCALPVVATPVGASAMMIDTSGIIVDEVSENAIATGLRTMLSAREQWEIMGNTGRQRMIALYDSTFITSQLLSYYKK